MGIIFRVLLYTFIITPYRLAFVEEDDLYWIMISAFVDFLFFVDIILTFFSAYFDCEDNLITQKGKIAKNYIRGWFILDFVSIFPFFTLISIDKQYNTLARIGRLPKLYKLLRMTK